MARPKTHNDLSDYDRQGTTLGDFHLTEFATNPAAIEAYAAFLKATGKDGAVAKVEHGHSTVRRPKTKAELDEALATKQRGWDTADKRYREVSEAIEGDTLQDLANPWRDYEAYGLRTHAEEEGYQVLALIDADGDTRKAVRQALGVE